MHLVTILYHYRHVATPVASSSYHTHRLEWPPLGFYPMFQFTPSMAKRQYGKWRPEDMVRALEEFKKGEIKLNECCRKYEIPKKTFLRHMRGEVKRGVSCGISMPVNGRETALPPDAEQELVRVIISFEESMFGLTITDIRKLAFQVLEANPHLVNPFNKEKRMAGKKWYYSFMKRHPELSLRQPENVSIARIRGFNSESVFHFYDILEKTVDENNLDALRIFNIDESGFSTVQKKSPKVVALKGKHQVGNIASGERGINTTFVCCTSASGNFVPPMIIFKRLRMHPSLKVGAPPGSIVEISETGYINTELFIKWLEHFIAYVKPSVEEKVLLVLDGHTTHSKNLEAIQLARSNGVLLLQLPGHTTHRLQPLDVSIFKPFQTYYDEAICKWLRTHEPPITQFEVAALLSEAYSRAATLSNAMSGFKATGIWPVDRNVFSDTDFIPAKTHSLTINRDTIVDNQPIDRPICADQQEMQVEESAQENRHIPVVVTQQQQTTDMSVTSPRRLRVTVGEVSPLPQPTAKQGKRLKKGAQSAELLTSSPYKNRLQEVKAKKALLIQKKLKSNESRPRCSSKQPRKVTTPVVHPSTSHQTEGLHPGLLDGVEVQVQADDWFCFLCEQTVLEDMVQCTACNKWAHEQCAGISKQEIAFVCDFCSQSSTTVNYQQ